MSHQNTKSSIGYCEENKRLLQEFTDAVSELSCLHDQQVAAMVAGDVDFGRFDVMIHTATEKKQEAKYAYIDHIDTHGC